jgi:4-amino-4-deoxychorismate lyase
MTRVLVNGRAGAAVDPLDRGLLYGDGLFETLAIVAGRPRFLEWHFERLVGGTRALGFPVPDLDAMRADIAQVATEPRCVVKIVLTRGLGERGYRPPSHPRPTRIVVASDWPAGPPHAATAGIRLGWSRMRLARNGVLAGVKHLNRLEQVLARAEWDDGVMDEALMQDDRGRVIAATQANLFACIDGAWVTPCLDECGVAGVMRRAFRAWGEDQGTPVVERALEVADVTAATSLVLTSALIGAWPVATLDGRVLSIAPEALAFNAWLARQ